jgi:predicted DNA-binding transcriptional regulator AlpA
MSKYGPPATQQGVGWIEQHVDDWIHSRIKGVNWVQPEVPEHPVMIRKAEVLRRVGLSHPVIWDMERRGQFPQRVRLTPQARDAAD